MPHTTGRPSPAFTLRQRLILRLLPPAATSLIRLLCLTLRFDTDAGPNAVPADASTDTGLYPFFHSTLLLAAYRYRNLGIFILISQSFDGELIARIVERLGFVPVRGSSSRGGAAGLLTLTRALQQGHKAAVTVDGPKGPRRVAKQGTAAIAVHANQPMRPFHLHPSRAWTLRSWDCFLIPKPFSRVRCVWAEPVPPTPGESAAQITAHLQQSLDAAARQAETLH